MSYPSELAPTLPRSVTVLCARYDSEDSEPETEAEMEMTDLWHISLHYLLPIIDWLQLHDREVMEDGARGQEGKENTAPSPGE